MSSERCVLVFNAGSSSLKIEAFTTGREPHSIVRGSVAGIGKPSSKFALGAETRQIAGVGDHRAAFGALVDGLASGAAGRLPLAESAVAATAHRVVHGGAEFAAPTRVDDAVLARLTMLAELAPLHNPPALAVMRLAREHFPGAPLGAAFDTAFFADLPEPARIYAVPAQWRERLHARRYGFHGIAHESMYLRYRQLEPERSGGRVLTLQLGQGCSIAALAAGRAVETSMGYTPLEGLIMGTRPGDVDAGLLIAAARAGESADALDAALNQHSGLHALGGTDDMRELLAREAAGDADAALAIAAFCHRAVKYCGAYAAVLGGVDAVLFGGGIGENAPAIRVRICAGLAWLGLKLDARANESSVGVEGTISLPGSAIDVRVLPVREEAAIARAVWPRLGVEES